MNSRRRSRYSRKPTPNCARRPLGKKSVYIKDLAEHIRDKKLDFHKFHRMTDDEIVEHLTQVKGIGKWTAEMFLMFNLGRPDVMPADDLGVRTLSGGTTGCVNGRIASG